MEADNQRKKSFIINAAYVVLIIGIFFVFFRYVLYAIMPFVIAALMTFMLKRPIDNLARSFNLPRRGTAGFVVLIFYIVLVVLCSWGLTQIFWSLFNWLSKVPMKYQDTIEPAIQSVLDWYEAKVGSFYPNKTEYFDQLSTDVLAKVSELISYVSTKLLGAAQAMVFGIPQFCISAIFCMVATAFMSMDFSKVKHFILHQFSEEHQKIMLDSKNYIVETFRKMITSYACIMFITMSELFVGLTIIGVEDANTLSLLIALFDILPALGTGGIMAPWIIIELINNNYILALQLFVLYAVITVVRNVLEPKIVGESIGLHPVFMLMSIYLGATIFGFLGIIILPFTLIVVKKLNDSGLIHVFESDYLPDEDQPGFFELKRRNRILRAQRKAIDEAEEAERKARRAELKDRRKAAKEVFGSQRGAKKIHEDASATAEEHSGKIEHEEKEL